MPLSFHGDAERQFQQQRVNARGHILPFVREFVPLTPETRILEVGCAEGGVLAAFADAGCQGTGVDLNEERIAAGNGLLHEEFPPEQVALRVANVYDPAVAAEFTGRFDLIILKDVIEHIHDRPRFLRTLRGFLKAGGCLFFGFPPWLMPFGGHQQIAHSRWGRLPYLHLLPKGVYRRTLERLGEDDVTVRELLEVYDTRLSLQEFDRLIAQCGFRFVRRQLYAVNPIYEQKFGLVPRKQWDVLGKVPVLRDLLATCCYALVRPEK